MSSSPFDSPADAVAFIKDYAVARSGFSSWLAVEPLTIWQGKSELILRLRPELTQHHGYAHGAVVGLMADNACAWAAASLVGDVVTGGYTIDFLRPAQGEQLRAKGTVIKAGKRQIVVRADVWAETEGAAPIHVAAAQSTIVPVGITG